MTDTGSFSFHTEILQAGRTATGIVIPDEIIERLGAGKKPPVKVTINGFTYRSTVAVMGGRYMVGVNAENREKAKVAGGDHVEVTIAVDREPRDVPIPPALAAILAQDATLRKAYDGLSYTNRRVIAEGVASAKGEDTRQRRIDKAIADLKQTAAKE